VGLGWLCIVGGRDGRYVYIRVVRRAVETGLAWLAVVCVA
jgi:hypothetical protein